MRTNIIGAAAILISSVFVYQIFSIKNSAKRSLAETRARLLEKNRVPYEKKSLTPHLSNKIQILQNISETRDLTRFHDLFFAATGGGLAKFSEDGRLIKHFTVADGLPESDLTCLKVWRERLYIGTRTKNLLVFDGEKFEQFIWNEKQVNAVTALAEKDGDLLIGTQKGGLLEFDGAKFKEIKAEGQMISGINCLFVSGEKLFVGTFDNGLQIDENDVWTHFTTAENLPSNRVVGIAEQSGKIYIAADFGLAIWENKNLRLLAVLPALSSIAIFDNRVFLTKDNGEIFTFDGAIKQFRAAENLQNSRFVTDADALWFLSNRGISAFKNGKLKSFSLADKNALSDNFVSALAFDKDENLWVGMFRGGVDVFAPDARKIKHLESESLREINFLQVNDDDIFAATSSGLQTIKKNFSFANQTKKDGLPSDSVTSFSGEYIATTKGLAFRGNGKIRVLSTVQGLPNNAVYAILQVNEKLYAGTLGGLAEIEANRVVRTYKDSNSNLKTNWITALIRAGERIFIGTYGGGVFEILPSGEIHCFEGEISKFVVNPNAMFCDDARLYIGTLEGAKVLDLRTQEWKTIKRILPSETVMSVTGDAKNIYFGTTSGIARIEKTYFENGESE